MLTFFLIFVRRPTLSKRPTRAVNSPWIQVGSDEATMPSSAKNSAA